MYQKWLIGFLTLNLLIVAVMEINYQINRKKYFRHAEDYTVNKLLVQEVGKNRDAVIMGDSVTHWALEGLTLSEKVYDLSATSSMTIVGQYMLLYRYLQQNEAPKDVYFFFIPEALMEDTTHTYSVVESIFDKKDEIKTIRMLKKGEVSDGGSYFYDRIRILKFWKQYIPHGKRSIDVKAVKKKLGDNDRPTFSSVKVEEKIQMNAMTQHVIMELIKLVEKHHIKLHFVLEPLKHENYLAYQDSNIKEFLIDQGIELIDFNDIYRFDDRAFYDGIHLNGVNADTYVYLIDKDIVPILQAGTH